MNAYLFIEWMKITVVGFLGLSGYIFEHLLRSCSHPDTLCFILKLLPVSRHVSLCVLTSSMSKSAANESLKGRGEAVCACTTLCANISKASQC